MGHKFDKILLALYYTVSITYIITWDGVGVPIVPLFHAKFWHIFAPVLGQIIAFFHQTDTMANH